MRDLIGRTLGHYRIVDKIGEGGMGEVYRGEDTSLKRHVAIKILPPEMAQSRERLGRFQREAETLAALDHPNVVHIYSVEEADGLPFLTMQLVEGERLSDLIPDRGMSLDQICEIAIPLADALAAAHEQNILHRDLKPANIMVTKDGRVKVLDFGLAKLRPQGEASQTTQLPTEPVTGEGRIVGTLPYMSPEQLEGKHLDQRSDIFSLGVVLYEMATGDRPFKGDSSVSLILSIGRDTPPEVDTLRGDLPHDLARIVRRCLEKTPDRRFQTMRDVRNEISDLKRDSQDGLEVQQTLRARNLPRRQNALKALSLVVITVVAVAAIAYLFFRFSPSSGPRSDSTQTSARGSLYENSSPEIKALLEQSLAYRRRGLSRINTEHAERTLRRAMSLEPDNPLVKAELANLLAYMQEDYPSKEHREEALRLAKESSDSDPNLAASWLALSQLSENDGCFDDAVRFARKAKEVAPGDYRGFVRLGYALASTGNEKQALNELRQAVEKEGGIFDARFSLACVLQEFGHLDEAVVNYKLVLNYAPDHVVALANLGAAYLMSGRYLEAVPVLRHALNLQPDEAAASNLGAAYFYLDRIEEAIEAYKLADRLHPDHPLSAYNLGEAYESIGDPESAREWYFTAVERCDHQLSAGGDRSWLLQVKWECVARTGRFEEAFSGIDELAVEEPNNADVLFTASTIHAIAGDKKGLLDYTERALRAGYPRTQFRQSLAFQNYLDDKDFSRLLEIDFEAP